MKRLYFLIALVLMSGSLFSQVNLANGLVACYPFDGNANDLSGNNHHGTVNGALLATDRFGNPNSAYDYDGVDDYINLGNYSDIIPAGDEFSLSAWIQYNLVKDNEILMLDPDDASDRMVATVHYDHNGAAYTFWDYGSITGGGRLYVANTVFSTNWEHYVFVTSYVNQYMKLYKNGVLVVTFNNASQITDRERDLRIGGCYDVANAPFFSDGKIDDMRIYDRVINDQEVAALYANNYSCSVASIAENPSSTLTLNSSFDGLAYLNNPLMKQVEIQIYDMAGRLVRVYPSTTDTRIKLDLSLNAAGTYTIHIKSADFVVTKKLVR